MTRNTGNFLGWHANSLTHAASYPGRHRFSDRIHDCQAGKVARVGSAVQNGKMMQARLRGSGGIKSKVWYRMYKGQLQVSACHNKIATELEIRDDLPGWQKIRARNKDIGLE